MPKGKHQGIGKRNTGGGKSRCRVTKRAVRAGFEARHIDQVWEDVRKQAGALAPQQADGTRLGPVGTTDRAELDADLPAQGRNYCAACSRYFISPGVLAEHQRTKPHKRRVKELRGPKPHSQLDADLAGGLGKPDNGPRLRPSPAAAPAVASQLPAPDVSQVMEELQRM